MKKAWMSLLCLVLCLSVLMPVGFASGTEAADEIMNNAGATSFTVLHTGDINAKIEGDDSAIGFAKVATLAEVSAETYPTLLLDSGNALADQDGRVIKVMENAQYTAAAIGTRDAALGIERLQELAARANFPLVCANWLKVDGDLYWDPYTIVEVGNVRIGVIGLIDPDIKEMYPEVTELSNVYDPAPIANIYYEEMVAQGCTYFIALTSLGYDGEYTPRTLGAKCPWLNLILDSNTTEETALDLGELVSADSGVIIFNLLPDFKQIGEIVVTTGTGDGMNTTLPAVYNAADLKDVPENAYVAGIIADKYAEPGSEDFSQQEEPADQPDTSAGKGVNVKVIYFACFGAIIAATAGIIIYITKKPAKKSDKK